MLGVRLRTRLKRSMVTTTETYRHFQLTWGDTPHIHVARESHLRHLFGFFEWIDREQPSISCLFRHTTAFSPLSAASGSTALFVPWIQDPVKERNPALYRRIRNIEAQYERAGVPIVNSVDVVSNAIKSRALGVIRGAGIKAARFVHVGEAKCFDAIAAEVGAPFIVRNDIGHGGYVRLVQTPEDFAAIDWTRLSHPVALQFIDTRSEDGLYRKYRYVFAGDRGAPRHLIITPSWCAHAGDRVRGVPYLNEEVEYLQSENPFHDRLNAVRKALALDYVAFDYSVDANGELVVWEPNPFPLIWARSNKGDPYFAYQHACVDRIYTCLLSYYLERAGISVSL